MDECVETFIFYSHVKFILGANQQIVDESAFRWLEHELTFEKCKYKLSDKYANKTQNETKTIKTIKARGGWSVFTTLNCVQKEIQKKMILKNDL